MPCKCKYVGGVENANVHAEDDRNRWLLSTLRCMEEFEHREKLATTKEERAARKEKSLWDAQKALAERKKVEDSFRANYERLKAERLAREPTNT